MILRATKFISAAIIAAYSLCGCSKIIYTVYNPVDKTLNRVSRLTNEAHGKEVLLVPMCHLGTEAHYAKVRNYLDSLKNEGYVTFCEGVLRLPYSMDTANVVTCADLLQLHPQFDTDDSLRIDTLLRKFRWVTGYGFQRYDTTADKNLVPRKFQKKGYIQQSCKLLGQVTDKDIWVDYSLSDIIGNYERKHGEIPLSEYDFATSFDEAYTMQASATPRNIYEITNSSRNDLVTRRILDTPYEKIAVVYGGTHTRMLKLYLRFLHGYELDKKYKVPKHQR